MVRDPWLTTAVRNCGEPRQITTVAWNRAVCGAVKHVTKLRGSWAVHGLPRHKPNLGGSARSMRTAVVGGTVVNTSYVLGLSG